MAIYGMDLGISGKNGNHIHNRIKIEKQSNNNAVYFVNKQILLFVNK